jgi:hypothetical protein
MIRSMTQDEQRKYVTIAGLALAGYVVYQISRGAGSLLEMLGLKDSADTVSLNNAVTDPGSPWNINFWKTGGSNVLIMTVGAAEHMLQVLIDSFEPFPFDDNEEQAIGVFRALKTQSQLSFLSNVFYNQYGTDFLTWLRGTGMDDRLSDSEVALINSFVLKLPKYHL